MVDLLIKYHRLLLSTMGIAFILTGLLVYLGRYYNWTEGHDKIDPNRRVVSYGGLVIFISYWLSSWRFLGGIWQYPNQRIVFLSSALLLLLGIIDDRLDLSPKWKSFGIIFCANLIYFGTDLHFASNLIPADWQQGYFLEYILTISWIFIVTNSINLLDGIDGLAASVSVSGLMTLAITSYLFSLSLRLSSLMLLLLLVSSIAGFIPWNWSPAKIFLGDTGALFIGFMYGVQSINNLKNIGFYTLILPVIFYLVPLFDTAYVILRRYLSNRSIVARDESHLHYSLRRSGFSDSQIVLIMVGVTIISSSLGLLSQVFATYRHWITLGVAGIAGIILLQLLSKNTHEEES